MRLSERLVNISVNPDDLSEFKDCISQARAMEAKIDTWPKQRKDDPDTSFFDGSISSLKENQQNVFTVFKILDGPVDSVTLERTYIEYGLPRQAPSGIRTRRKELLRLGLIEWVDTEGVSDTGRSARRWQVRKPSHEGTT